MTYFPVSLLTDLVIAHCPAAAAGIPSFSLPWKMMVAALLTLTIHLLRLTTTEAEHYSCSPQKNTIELNCSGFSTEKCNFLPKKLEVHHCNYEKIHHLQYLFPNIFALRFIFTNGWKPREDTFVRWSSLRALDISNNEIKDLPSTHMNSLNRFI